MLASGWSRVANAAQAIRLNVGAPPGGGTDIVARVMAMQMEAELKRSVIVENKPGAGGNIAATRVAQAVGDANQLLMAYTSLTINPNIQAGLSFDPIKSFTPLSLVATSPLLLVCRPELPVTNTAELFAYARSNPGTLSIAGQGLGSASQLSGEMLKAQAKLNIIAVPYKGAVETIQALLGGQVQLVMSDISTVRPLIATGKLKALGVSTAEPLPDYPDLAPIARVLPGFDYRAWYGILAPAGLNEEQVTTLESAARASARSDAVTQRLIANGLQPVGSTNAEFKTFLETETKRWAAVAAATGLRLG
jgi:tripartite-type tricarboxylate transporter receptor subunit TctC